MKNKIIMLLLLVVSVLTLASCGNNGDKTPVVSNVNLDANGGRVNGQMYATIEYTEGEGLEILPNPKKAGYTFVGWMLDGEIITEISTEQTGEVSLVAEWKAFEYKTPQTDSLKLTEDYEGKDFYEDGIGVVTVQQYVDGDTTIVRTLKGHKITIRYNGIDTPESTYKVEAWGFSAANFTEQKLRNAKEIVLATEDGKPGKDNADSTGNRYLAWVWADGRLVNLDIVENALANAKASDTKYAEYFQKAVTPLVAASVRVYGEQDPDFDYSKSYADMSLKELRFTYGNPEAINQELSKGKKIKISGTVTRKNGPNSAYLQQVGVNEETGEIETYGVYLYGGYVENHKLAVGNKVIITGQIGYYGGSLQVTDVTAQHVKVQKFGTNDDVQIEEVQDLKTYVANEMNIGNIIKITTPLTVTAYHDATSEESDATTLTATYKDASNVTQQIDIRIDKNIALFDENGDRIESGSYFQGKTFSSLTCIVGYYDYSQDKVHNGRIQLMLTLMTDISYAE